MSNDTLRLILVGVGCYLLGGLVILCRKTPPPLAMNPTQYQTLVDNLDLGIILVDRHNGITFANHSTSNMLHLSPQEIIEYDLDAILGPNVPPRNASLAEIEIARFDRSHFPAIVRSIPLYGKRQRTTGSIVIIENITLRKEAEQQINMAQRQMLEIARKSGMSEVATHVLHNIGNSLNSVNITLETLRKHSHESKGHYLNDVIQMLQYHKNDFTDFVTQKEQGPVLIDFLCELGSTLAEEQQQTVEALDQLTFHVQQISQVVQLQRTYHVPTLLPEPSDLCQIVDDAIRINVTHLPEHPICLEKQYAHLPEAMLDRHKLLQILSVLIHNACLAVQANQPKDCHILIRIRKCDPDRFSIDVIDNGEGIPQDHLTKVFEYGFSLYQQSSSHALHTAALTAQEIGGQLQVQSKGPHQGACFTLDGPLHPIGESSCL